MALRRKKIKDADGNFIEKPVRCGICKDATTVYTVHGGIATGRCGGHTCCDKCFEILKAEEFKGRGRNSEQSEAEYQLSKRWGI